MSTLFRRSDKPIRSQRNVTLYKGVAFHGDYFILITVQQCMFSCDWYYLLINVYPYLLIVIPAVFACVFLRVRFLFFIQNCTSRQLFHLKVDVFQENLLKLEILTTSPIHIPEYYQYKREMYYSHVKLLM